MEVKRLYRSREDRWIAGVGGGLARYFGMDPTPLRLGFILLLGGFYLLIRNVDLFSQTGERIVALLLIVGGFIILLLRPGRIWSRRRPESVGGQRRRS